MVKEAESYGAMATFNKPSLSTDSLSNIMTSLACSINTSKTEVTDLATGNARIVRMDVKRERSDAPDDMELTDKWITFRNNSDSHYVVRVWSWSYKNDCFVMLMDPRCVICYTVVATCSDLKADPRRGVQCQKCQACFVCLACERQGKLEQHCKSEECNEWLCDRRHFLIVSRSIPSFSVGMKNDIFGEGVERIVHKFRYLDENGKFIGPKMVAKQSRFVEEHGTYKQRMDYMSEFMRTQAIASEFATKFNAALDALTESIREPYVGWIENLPRIRFLEAFAVEAISGQTKTSRGKVFNILIEELLEGKYEKYNDNMGMVKGQARREPAKMDPYNELQAMTGDIGVDMNGPVLKGDLGAIEEGDSEDDDSDDDGYDDDETSYHRHASAAKNSTSWNVKDDDFPQAFSHFTFEASKKHMMVVDLQGVFLLNKDGTREYRLTDPVIHKRRKSEQLKNWSFGRTDRGEKGIAAFWATHKCSDACRMLGLYVQSVP